MKCPICTDENLVMADRQGIEIDYCPKCRGVWLDRGELDKIIERSAVAVPQGQPQSQSQPRGDYREPPRHYSNQGHYKKKKGGLLGELFDF
ncbi:zf-TFIIB domain-containing protein [Marinimicrobium agarilyticum]|uniref:TFIIB-type zinc ribbon-containing protein n=1 Tax=Marinimicrobium agarilyticum TaxID=306546 RepID=UPI000418D34A|nr:zf-TFIIB domain-containing protein [Marinimicrobium agarilyticum]